MATTDLNYHSYFCIFTKTESDTSCTNPFKAAEHAGNGWVEGTNYNIVSSPDYSFDPSTGKVRLKAPGNYFIIANVGFDTNSLLGNTYNLRLALDNGGTAAVVGGTSVEVQGSGLNTNLAWDCVVHYVTKSESDFFNGDSVREDESKGYFVSLVTSGTCKCVAGTSLTIIKANGSFGSKTYKTDSDAQEDEDYDLFKTSEGGTFHETSDGVTINNDGEFSPDATRKFLMLSSVIMSNAQPMAARHRLKIGSSNDEVVDYEIPSGTFERCNTISYLKEVANSSFVRINNGVSDSDDEVVTIKSGTGLTLFDISNKGTDPGAYLSFSTTKDTDTFSSSSGDKNIFDQENYGSNTITKDDNVTASNITYAADGGTFTIAKGGVYLVMLVLQMDSSETANTGIARDCDFNITSGGATTTYYTKKLGPYDGSTNMTQLASVLVPLEANDVLTFTVHDLEGKLNGGSSGGSSITIVKIDGVGGSKDIFPKETASAQIGDDYTLNTLSRDVLGNQHDDLVNKRVPVSTAQPGPRHLRGRLTSYNVTSGGKK